MTLYLGRPGALVELPDPDPGVTATPVRAAADHQLLGGGRVVDLLGTPRRIITASWTRLLDDEYALLEEFHSGARGSGPFALLPSAARWNYLTTGQAAATSATANTSGWTVTASESVASVSAPVLRGPRCLAWTVPAAPTSGLLAPVAPGGAPGWSTPPAVAWYFAAAVRASTGAPEVTARLRWLDAAGTQLSISIGPPLTISASGWLTAAVAATAPAGAVYVVPRLYLTAATIPAPTTVYVDTPRLGIGTSGSWTPGRGLPLVTLTDLTDTYPWADVHDAKAVFTEVG
ncbi:hypothetical protein [Catellatospora sp. NPDC049609]|uniref:hypothetical protein n=1 Tax=Catellatospora sp. NPDC049609 TaxID=3155505 RepID=UPI003420E5C4